MTILISPTFSNNNLSFRTLTLLLFDALALSISNQNVSSNFSEVTFFPSFTVFNKRYKRICLTIGVKLSVISTPSLSKTWNPPKSLTVETGVFNSTTGVFAALPEKEEILFAGGVSRRFLLTQKKTTKNKPISNKRHITKINWLLFFSVNPLFWITSDTFNGGYDKE